MNKKQSLSQTKKAQVSTIDFISGFMILTIAIILIVHLISTIEEPSNFSTIKRQTITATDNLLSEGYPTNWNQTTIIQLGTLTNQELNKTKLEQINTLSYEEIKQTLNGVTNIYWYYTNKTTIQNITSCGYGDPTILTNSNCEPQLTQENNLVRIDRFVTYNNTILRMVVLTWD